MSMFSENQSRRTKEDLNESNESGKGGEKELKERKQGKVSDEQIPEQTGPDRRASPPEEHEEDDHDEEQKRLDDYLDDQRQLIADHYQEKPQGVTERKKSKKIEEGRSEGRFGESFHYTEHNDKNRGENHQRWKRLKELSKLHINQIVEDEMRAGNIGPDTWAPYLHKFVIQAVDSVKPSSRYLKDSMDFNKFVEIQLLDHRDASKSQYVNGCVVMKNLADKRMPRHFDNPSILLLKGSLGFMRDSEDCSDPQTGRKQEIYMDINSVINQEEHYV